MRTQPLRVMTVGHSTRTLDDFVALLRAHGVKRVIDVRTIPRSRHNPHFDRRSLAARLRSARLHYRHFEALGGLRHPHQDSPNTAWRNASFRGFADYMQTRAFREALERLIRLARQEPAALLCAEAVPWRCHRSLIADALAARGVLVEHILAPGRRAPHRLTPFARVRGRRVTYPAEAG